MKRLLFVCLVVMLACGCAAKDTAVSFVSPLDSAAVTAGFGSWEGFKAVQLTKEDRLAGAEVKASEAGTIVSVEKGAAGYNILMKHDDEYETAYMGLSAPQVKKGQKVDQGEVIGELDGSKSAMEFVVIHNGERLESTQTLIGK
ncbi:MAG: M23 family metallopeptidase [Erysipelotrichaceae bacterium]|nr:M23 family metallopeptidase [Erysipelotrichaceae bacterium]